MTGRLGILIVLLITVVLCALYFFLGRGQIVKHIEELRAENNQLSSELAGIIRMEQEIPELEEQVPFWYAQSQFLRRAVPERISDEVFLANLARELDGRNVELLSISVGRGGSWLGNLNDEQIAELRNAGLDVEAARQVRYAVYSASLLGEYGDVLMAFESLKGYGRVYSVDSIVSPAGARGGVIMQDVSTSLVPVEVTGRIYYGVDQEHLSLEGLEEVFFRAAMRPLVDELQAKLGDVAMEFAPLAGTLEQGTAPEAEQPETGDENGDEPVTGLQGWLMTNPAAGMIRGGFCG